MYPITNRDKVTEVLKKNIGLIYKILTKRKLRNNDDAFQEACIGLIEGYQRNRGNLGTSMYLGINGRITRCLVTQRGPIRIPPEGFRTYPDDAIKAQRPADFKDILKDKNECEEYDFTDYLRGLNDVEKHIITRFYRDDIDCTIIAKELDLSRCTIYHKKSIALKKIKAQLS